MAGHCFFSSKKRKTLRLFFFFVVVVFLVGDEKNEKSERRRACARKKKNERSLLPPFHLGHWNFLKNALVVFFVSFSWMLAALSRRTLRHALGSTCTGAPLVATTRYCSEKMSSTAAAAAADADAGKKVQTATNPNPPPDASRGATADLCDVFYPDPVDVIPDPSKQRVQIAEPIFR